MLQQIQMWKIFYLWPPKQGITDNNYKRLWCTIGCTSRATLEISARWLNITIYQILCQRWFWETLQFRRFLELFLLLQFQNHMWYRMVYIVIFNRLAGIPYVALQLCGRWYTYRLSKNSSGTKSCLMQYRAQSCGIRSRLISDIQIPSICTNTSKSTNTIYMYQHLQEYQYHLYVPTPPRVPIISTCTNTSKSTNNRKGTIPILSNKNRTFVSSFTQSAVTNGVLQIN